MKMTLGQRITSAIKKQVSLAKIGFGMKGKGLSPIEAVKEEVQAVKDSLLPVGIKDAIKSMPSVKDAVKEEVQDVMDAEIFNLYRGMRQGSQALKTIKEKEKFIDTLSDELLTYHMADHKALSRKIDIGTKEGVQTFLKDIEGRKKQLDEDIQYFHEQELEYGLTYSTRERLVAGAKLSITESIKPDYVGVWSANKELIPSDRLAWDQARYYKQEQDLLLFAKRFQDMNRTEKLNAMLLVEQQMNERRLQAETNEQMTPEDVIITPDNYKNFYESAAMETSEGIRNAETFIEKFTDKFFDIPGIDELQELYEQAIPEHRSQFMSMYRQELNIVYDNKEAITNEYRTAQVEEAIRTLKEIMGIGKMAPVKQ